MLKIIIKSVALAYPKTQTYRGYNYQIVRNKMQVLLSKQLLVEVELPSIRLDCTGSELFDKQSQQVYNEYVYENRNTRQFNKVNPSNIIMHLKPISTIGVIDGILVFSNTLNIYKVVFDSDCNSVAFKVLNFGEFYIIDVLNQQFLALYTDVDEYSRKPMDFMTGIDTDFQQQFEQLIKDPTFLAFQFERQKSYVAGDTHNQHLKSAKIMSNTPK